jgi:GMP synthase (glutamine-hydrolysing)
MSLRTAAVIRHVAFEDLGVFERVLAQRGIAVRYVDAGVDHLEVAEIANADLVIVLGGPIGVYDEPSYPFLAAELRLIERRLRVGAPLLGVCLGAQLIAAAAGARVYPGPAKEIGFAPVTLTPEGQMSSLGALSAARNTVLHWHGDTFDLPLGAVRLASTPVTANQAFSLGANVLALQFHMEADPRSLERWLIGHTVEIAQSGLDVASLRAQIGQYGASVAAAGSSAFSLWLDGLKLGARDAA